MRVFRRVRQSEWQRVRGLGRTRYIWSQYVLPFGIPAGVLIAVDRFGKLGLHWQDILTPIGAAIAYFCVASSALLTAGWGFLAWRRNVREFGGAGQDEDTR
jgi:hypothetical protein